LNDLERRLAGWRPAGGDLDRDRMLFQSGEASARARTRERSWAVGFAVSLLVSIGLGVELVRERSYREGVEKALVAVAHPSVPSVPPPAIETYPLPRALPSDSYFSLTRRYSAGVEDPLPVHEARKISVPPIPKRPLMPLDNYGFAGRIDL
jgi:hypothetical protein